jgi:hypothetical protein
MNPGTHSLRIRSLALSAGIAVTGCMWAPSAFAQSQTGFTYQGQLKAAGTAVNGPIDARFIPYPAPDSGSALAGAVTQSNIQVTDGLFSTTVDFGAVPFTTNQPVWMEIEIASPAGSGLFVPLGTRQRLTPTPFSIATRGINVNSAGDVGVLGRLGIGSNTPGAALLVSGGPDTNHVRVTSSSAIGTWLNIGNTSAGGHVWSLISAGSGNVEPVGSLLIRDTTTFGVPMVLSPTGNVGLGTNTPANKLSVIGNADFSGNVGLGTATPTVKLDVNGDIRASRIGVGLTPFDSTPFAVGRDDSSFLLRLFDYGLTDSTELVAEFDGRGANRPQLRFGSSNPGWVDIGQDASGSFVIEQRDVPGFVVTTSRNVGIGTSTPAATLDVVGDIRCTSLTQTSARQFKQDILPLTNALDSIMRLQGVSYAWNSHAPQSVRGTRDIGFIADEVNNVLPDIVAKDENGTPVGIDYGKIAPITVEAIKQLKAANDGLAVQNAALEARIARLEKLLQGSKPTLSR